MSFSAEEVALVLDVAPEVLSQAQAQPQAQPEAQPQELVVEDKSRKITLAEAEQVNALLQRNPVIRDFMKSWVDMETKLPSTISRDKFLGFWQHGLNIPVEDKSIDASSSSPPRIGSTGIQLGAKKKPKPTPLRVFFEDRWSIGSEEHHKVHIDEVLPPYSAYSCIEIGALSKFISDHGLTQTDELWDILTNACGLEEVVGWSDDLGLIQFKAHPKRSKTKSSKRGRKRRREEEEEEEEEDEDESTGLENFESYDDKNVHQVAVALSKKMAEFDLASIVPFVASE